jgi:hypothetical protein
MIEHLLKIINVPGFGNLGVSIASRKIHSVCDRTGEMFSPVTSVERAKTALSLSSRKR